MLFACVHLPDFAVQAAVRLEPPLNASALAILDGPDSSQKVFACNESARQLGIYVGMRKTDLSVLPGVVQRKRLIEQEATAHSVLLDCAYTFSPRVESTCPGTVILDLIGSQRLQGSPINIGNNLRERAAQCGIEAQVALAANPDTALHAARGFTGVTVINAGQEAQRLARLPVDVLQPEPEILDTLESWGIRTFGALANLPIIELTQRLGQKGLFLQQSAKGEIERALVPAQPAEQYRERIELEEPLELLEPLGFVMNRLLEQLVTRLLMRSLATDYVELTLSLEVHTDHQLTGQASAQNAAQTHQRTLKLPVPTSDAKVILNLFQLDLAEHPPAAPVKGMTIEAFPARIRRGQAGLFQPPTPEPAKLEVSMARLRAVVGEEDESGCRRVGFPVPLDSHRPDSFEVLPFRSETNPEMGQPRCSGPKLMLRFSRPPLQISVELAAGIPLALFIKGQRKTVLYASGPWRKDGAWWDSAKEWQRDEWDVELNVRGSKALYRLYRDEPSGQWFAEGIYD